MTWFDDSSSESTFMQFPFRMLAAAYAVVLFSSSPASHAQADSSVQSAPRSYAVMSLAGNALHLYAVRPEVHSRMPGETRQVLNIADQVFDNTALVVANLTIKQVEPPAKVVLMMTQDAGLYAAQNEMFDKPDANKDNRDYLMGLLKEQGVSHLILVTKHRDNAFFELSNGSAGTGLLEGLGFYIDDTTRLRSIESSNSSSGMVGPFAFLKIRLLDASTLALVKEVKANRSLIVTKPSAQPSALAIWTTLPNEQKIAYINALISEVVTEELPALLRE